jgi:hypothetical protein
MQTKRRTANAVVALALSGAFTLVLSGAVAGVAHADVLPDSTSICHVSDSPDVTGNPPWQYSVDLHTAVECFDVPVSVG